MIVLPKINVSQCLPYRSCSKNVGFVYKMQCSYQHVMRCRRWWKFQVRTASVKLCVRC